MSLNDKCLTVTKGKTKSSIRRVPLSEKAKKILKGRISRFDGACLFPHNDIDGNKPTGSLVHIHLKTIRALGVNFRIYDARRTFATRAIEDDADLITLAAIPGYSSLKMLTRHARPSEKLKADAIPKMEKGQAKAV